MSAPLITFRQLSVSFAAEKQRVRAVQEVSFAIHAGQTVGSSANPAAEKASPPWP
jgi:peptide/nickel transport system ATP-binding protein